MIGEIEKFAQHVAELCNEHRALAKRLRTGRHVADATDAQTVLAVSEELDALLVAVKQLNHGAKEAAVAVQTIGQHYHALAARGLDGDAAALKQLRAASDVLARLFAALAAKPKA